MTSIITLNIVSDANLHKFWKQFTTKFFERSARVGLFPMQIYTNFESNSQQRIYNPFFEHYCFRCKFTQILKAIHNTVGNMNSPIWIVSDANLHKFWKQFTTESPLLRACPWLFPMQIYTNFESNSQLQTIESDKKMHCFRCKFTQILKAIHNASWVMTTTTRIVSDANLHKFWKQFTTIFSFEPFLTSLFPMQIYTNFESNSQLSLRSFSLRFYCFRCKFTQILKAIHNFWRV